MRRISETPLKTEPVHLQDGLAIYKQPKGPKRGSPNWYARVNLEVGGRKVHIKTTGTCDFALARDRVRDFYVELLIQRKGGIVD